MPDVPLPAPFEAYTGGEPYLFASYAHADGAIIYPELTYLRHQGYRIWYDEGIDPGNEWPEEVAKALAGASFFLVFISPAAVRSQNVRNEINYALNNHKPFLAIHVKETELPPGLQLRMGDIQAIMKYRMADDPYQRKIEKTLPVSLKSTEVIEERGLEVKRTEEIFTALKRVIGNGETWRFGLVTIWRTEHTNLVVSAWEVDWESISLSVATRFRQMVPPRVMEPVDDVALLDCANRFVRCSRVLQPELPASKLHIGISQTPHFDPPWHEWKHMGLGDVDFWCKQCGYDGFNLGHYDSDRKVPTECPKCALGRDMPEDTRTY